MYHLPHNSHTLPRSLAAVCFIQWTSPDCFAWHNVSHHIAQHPNCLCHNIPGVQCSTTVPEAAVTTDEFQHRAVVLPFNFCEERREQPFRRSSGCLLFPVSRWERDRKEGAVRLGAEQSTAHPGYKLFESFCCSAWC